MRSKLLYSFVVSTWAVAVVLAVPRVSATVITVDAATDSSASASACRLRDAIVAANANASVNGCSGGSSTEIDAIVFAVGVHYIFLESSLPTLTESVVIQGPGRAQLVIDGDDQHRPITIADHAGSIELRVDDRLDERALTVGVVDFDCCGGNVDESRKARRRAEKKGEGQGGTEKTWSSGAVMEGHGVRKA